MPVLRRPPLCCATMGSALASERPAAEDRLAPQNRSLGTCNGQCGMHECCEALQEPRPLKAQDSSSHAASVMLQRVNGMTAGMCMRETITEEKRHCTKWRTVAALALHHHLTQAQAQRTTVTTPHSYANAHARGRPQRRLGEGGADGARTIRETMLARQSRGRMQALRHARSASRQERGPLLPQPNAAS